MEGEVELRDAVDASHRWLVIGTRPPLCCDSVELSKRKRLNVATQARPYVEKHPLSVWGEHNRLFGTLQVRA